MNKQLAEQAKTNIRRAGMDNTTPGHCAGWARETVTDIYGAAVANPPGLDAGEAFEWYKARGKSIELSQGHTIGDILFKFPTKRSPHGHVEIRIEDNRSAGNSSAHINSKNDARGIRTLKAFGKVDGIVRLP